MVILWDGICIGVKRGSWLDVMAESGGGEKLDRKERKKLNHALPDPALFVLE